MKLIPVLLGITSLALSCNYSRIKTTEAPTAGTPAGGSITDSQWLTQNLFQARCASCHNGGRQPGGHKFATEKDLLDNVTRKTIVVGSPATSSLYTIIESGNMPKGSEKATSMELSVLSCWITEGASAESTTCVQKFGLSGQSSPGGTQTPTPTTAPTPGSNPGGDGRDDDGRDDDGRDDDGRDDDGRDDDGNDDDGSDDDGNDDDGNDSGDSDDGDDGNGAGDGDDGQVPEVKFSEIQQPIFVDRCVSCHGPDGHSAGVNLETFGSIINPADGPALVQCGNAEASLLYTIVASDEMPAFSEALSSELKLKLKNWINGGCQP